MKRNSNSSDFRNYEDNPKRRFNENNSGKNGVDDKQNNQSTDKVGDYVRELMAEKSQLEENKLTNAAKLVEQEISKVQNLGRIPPREFKYVNIYREKPIKVSAKVLVPVQEYPRFNFVGKLLGPKGNSLKRLQEETMCKMSILGKGSMKDPQKEEELKASEDPKYTHLAEDLHVEVSAFGPPAEAHARMAFALAEVRKYLIPDKNDNIRQEQLRELESINGPPAPGNRNSYRGPGNPRENASRPPHLMRTATRAPVVTPRVMPAKVKIMSILDRARLAMEESYQTDEPSGPYGFDSYDDQSSNYRYEDAEFAPNDYYRKNSPSSYGDPSSQRWKPSPSANPRSAENPRYRSGSYGRPSMKDSY